MTLRLLTEPGFGIRRGAAGGTPAAFRLYGAAYTVRFLGRPEENAAG